MAGAGHPHESQEAPLPSRMKAVVADAYGPPEVLRVEERPLPSVGPKDVLIRIRAVSLNFGDVLARDFGSVSPRQFSMPFLFWLGARLHFGLRRPRVSVLGNAFSGLVVAVGRAVSRFAPGDEVFGFSSTRMGACAEYLAMPEGSALAPKPRTLDFEQASTLPYGALMAMGLLEHAQVQPGQRVLVNGASGGIGSPLVQLLRHLHGAKVTGVCGPTHLAFVRALGADQVHDHRMGDITGRGDVFERVIDIPGSLSFRACRRMLTPNGRCLKVSFKGTHLAWMAWTSLFGGTRLVCALASEAVEDLHRIRDLADASILQPHIHRCFPMDQAVDAHRAYESPERTGAVVLTLP